MLIHTDGNEYICNHVEFIEYTGCFPNLCSGTLTLKIDGEIVKFGHNYRSYDYKTHTFTDGVDYDSFWESGGGLDGDYCPYSGEWRIDVGLIPEKYRKYSKEIDDVFNDNVPYGCCGGCA